MLIACGFVADDRMYMSVPVRVYMECRLKVNEDRGTGGPPPDGGPGGGPGLPGSGKEFLDCGFGGGTGMVGVATGGLGIVGCIDLHQCSKDYKWGRTVLVNVNGPLTCGGGGGADDVGDEGPAVRMKSASSLSVEDRVSCESWISATVVSSFVMRLVKELNQRDGRRSNAYSSFPGLLQLIPRRKHGLQWSLE